MNVKLKVSEGEAKLIEAEWTNSEKWTEKKLDEVKKGRYKR